MSKHKQKRAFDMLMKQFHDFLGSLTIAFFLMLTPTCSPKNNLNTLKNFNTQKISSEKPEGPEECPAAPEILFDFAPVPFYTDAKYSKVDKSKASKNSEILKPLNTFKAQTAKLSETYFSEGSSDPRHAACTLGIMFSWAKENALLGKTSLQGKNEIIWALGSISLSYLRIKDEPSLDKNKKAVVEDWLKKLARFVETYDKSHPRKNNHAYWTGLALAATGTALQDMSLYGKGLQKYHLFRTQIQTDGTLPLELQRGEKSFAYHCFSALPLLLIAELAYANGDDLYKDGALDKLVNRVFDSLDSTSYFDDLTKVKQKKVPAEQFGFLEIYYRHKPQKRYADFLKNNRPFRNELLSMDISLLFGQKL